MKARASRRRVEEIEVELDGEIHRGERIVTGVHELHQVVQFEVLRKRDVNDYEPGDEAFMRAIAKVILRDLVEQWKAQGVRRPAKVEPRGRPHRRRSTK